MARIFKYLRRFRQCVNSWSLEIFLWSLCSARCWGRSLVFPTSGGSTRRGRSSTTTGRWCSSCHFWRSRSFVGQALWIVECFVEHIVDLYIGVDENQMKTILNLNSTLTYFKPVSSLATSTMIYYQCSSQTISLPTFVMHPNHHSSIQLQLWNPFYYPYNLERFSNLISHGWEFHFFVVRIGVLGDCCHSRVMLFTPTNKSRNIKSRSLFVNTLIYVNTVKPVYNDHPRDPKFVAIVDRWWLFRGSFIL